MIFPWGVHRPDDPKGALWDILGIGAGMGGGLLGSALAQSGRKTLFLERGPAVNPPARGRRSIRTRRFLSEAGLVSRGPVGQTRCGPLGRPLKACSNPAREWARRLLGDLRRDARAIFSRGFRRMRGGEVDPPPMPNRWPIGYHELLLYYRKAEEALRVCGGRDPSDPNDDSALRTPPPLSERDEAIFRDFEKAGLRPFGSISASTMSPAVRNVWAICVHGIASPTEPAGV
jgi:choline dehydrogenase-like flavoprotein